MSAVSQAFRRVAAQACAGRNLFREFMVAGLEDILEEADVNGWSASEISYRFSPAAASRTGDSTISKPASLPSSRFSTNDVGGSRASVRRSSTSSRF